MSKKRLTKEENKLAQKRASELLDKIMPRGRRGDPRNVERGIKYQELLKEERKKIKNMKEDD